MEMNDMHSTTRRQALLDVRWIVPAAAVGTIGMPKARLTAGCLISGTWKQEKELEEIQ